MNLLFFFFCFSHGRGSKRRSQAVSPCSVSFFLQSQHHHLEIKITPHNKRCYYHALSNCLLQLKAHPPLLLFLALLFRLPCFPILPPRPRPQALHEPQGPKYVSPPSPIFIPCFATPLNLKSSFLVSCYAFILICHTPATPAIAFLLI